MDLKVRPKKRHTVVTASFAIPHYHPYNQPLPKALPSFPPLTSSPLLIPLLFTDYAIHWLTDWPHDFSILMQARL
jgi:hypothetical protein